MTIKVGFKYTVDVVDRFGRSSQAEAIHNLVPTEGLNNFLGVQFKGSAQTTVWFLGIFEGNYTPVANDTAATFPASATESTTYNESTRVVFVSSAVSAGTLDNSANRAEFTMNAAKTIYGAFMSSQAAKGSTLGVLLSAVQFSSPKILDIGSVLRVTAGLTMTSA